MPRYRAFLVGFSARAAMPTVDRKRAALAGKALWPSDYSTFIAAMARPAEILRGRSCFAIGRSGFAIHRSRP
jgi:hypothetical protein